MPARADMSGYNIEIKNRREFLHGGLELLVGLEPTACALRMRCSSLRNMVALLAGSLRNSPYFVISPPRFIVHRTRFGGSTN